MSTLLVAGEIAIILEILLLLIWTYSVYFKRHGTDAAGRGIALVFLLGLAVYIIIGALLLLTRSFWAMVFTLIMAAGPLGLVIKGLLREYGAKRQR